MGAITRIATTLVIALLMSTSCSATNTGESRDNRAVVPDVRGLSIDDAMEAIDASHLTVSDPFVGEAVVTSQTPRPGTQVPRGTEIDLTVSPTKKLPSPTS